MDHVALKRWRKARQLSQQACANRLNVDLRTWQHWEYGETPIPEFVKLFTEQETARSGKFRDDIIPPGTSARVAHALRIMDRYYETFTRLGPRDTAPPGRTPPGSRAVRDSPYWFAATFWTSGICRWPFMVYGQYGTHPEPAALKAALDKVRQFMNDGQPWKQLALCADCPADIKAMAGNPKGPPNEFDDPCDPNNGFDVDALYEEATNGHP